jgi:hypothetical protein
VNHRRDRYVGRRGAKLTTLRASSKKEPMAAPPPFSRYEFFIAWRYLRARRAEAA